MLYYIFDIEANGFNEVVINKSKKIIPGVTKIHCLVLRNADTNEVKRYRYNDIENTLEEGWKELLSADTIIGHNIIMYDLPVLKRFLSKPKKLPIVFDTLVASRLLYPDVKNHPFGGNSLEDWGRYLTVPKTDYQGGFEKWTEEMEEYCCQDTAVNLALYDFLLDELKPFEVALNIEHEVARIIAEQQNNGIKINIPCAEKFYSNLQKESSEIEKELQAIFEPTRTYMKTPQYWEMEGITAVSKKELRTKLKEAGYKKINVKLASPGPLRYTENLFNPNSSKQIVERFIKKYNYKPIFTEPTESNPKGNPSITEEELQSLDYPEAKLIFKYQMCNKRMQHLEDWIARANNSRTPSIIHPQINTCGAATSRMTHQQPNQTACPKVIVGKNKEGKKAPILGFEGRWGWECRCLWGPTKEGWVQVGVDASGLELRMLGNRMWEFDGGKYAKEVIEGDVHTLNMQSGNLLTRDQSKTCIYALLYGSGNKALGFQIVNHPSLSAEQRKSYAKVSNENAGIAFRSKIMKNLPALKKLIDYCHKQAAEKEYVTLLDGRQAPTRAQYAALNTLLQGDGAIVMKVALMLSEQEISNRGWEWGEDFAFMLNAHDEFQLECKPEIAQDIADICVMSIEEAGRYLNVKCPLTGEAKIGKNWAETH